MEKDKGEAREIPHLRERIKAGYKKMTLRLFLRRMRKGDLSCFNRTKVSNIQGT